MGWDLSLDRISGTRKRGSHSVATAALPVLCNPEWASLESVTYSLIDNSLRNTDLFPFD